MGLEDKASMAMERMFEFYEQKELVQFVSHCNRWSLPYYKSVLFLDGQTRFDYQMSEQTPEMPEYMTRVYEYFTNGDGKNDGI